MLIVMSMKIDVMYVLSIFYGRDRRYYIIISLHAFCMPRLRVSVAFAAVHATLAY